MTVEELKKAGVLPQDYVSLEERRKQALAAQQPTGSVLLPSQAEFYQRRAGDGRYTPETATEVQESYAQYGKDYTTGTRKAQTVRADKINGSSSRGGRTFGETSTNAFSFQTIGDAVALARLATKDVQNISEQIVKMYDVENADSIARYRPQSTAFRFGNQLFKAQQSLNSAVSYLESQGVDVSDWKMILEEIQNKRDQLSNLQASQRQFTDEVSYNKAVLEYQRTLPSWTVGEERHKLDRLKKEYEELYGVSWDSNNAQSRIAQKLPAGVDITKWDENLKALIERYGLADIGVDSRESLQAYIRKTEADLDKAKIREDVGSLYNHYSRMTDWSENAQDVEEKPSYYEQMTNEERQVYNYLYHTQGKFEAKKFYRKLKDLLVDRWESKDLEGTQRFAEKHPFWASVGSVGATIASGLEYIGDSAKYAVTGKLDDNFMAKTGAVARGTVAEQVDWNIPALNNWDAFDYVYNTGMSGVDSLAAAGVTAATGAPVGGIMLGLSAAASGTNDALERGLSNSQAFWTGVSQGVFEGFFESVSIGNLLKESSVAGLKSFAKNLAISMGVNASEEAATEIANVLYDTLVNGDLSNYAIAVEKYMAQGLSEKDARSKAARDISLQIGEAAGSGALMGVGFGGISGAKTWYQNYKAGKGYQKTGDVSAFIDFAKANFSPDTQTFRIADQLTPNATATQIGALIRSVGMELSEQNLSDIRLSLIEKGIAPDLAQKVVGWLNEDLGITLSTVEQAAIFDSNPEIKETLIEVVLDNGGSVNQRNTQYKALVQPKATVPEVTAESAATPQESAEAVPERTVYDEILDDVFGTQATNTDGYTDVVEVEAHTGIKVTEDDIHTADAAIDEDQRAFHMSVRTGTLDKNQAVYDESQVKSYQNDAARTFSRVLSRKVYFYNGSDQYGTDSAFVGKNGAIYINGNAPATRNNIAIVLGHEYVHTLEGTEEYTAMRDAIFASETFAGICAQTGMTKDEMVAQIQKQYATAGRQLTPEAAERELVAQFIAERLLQDLNALRQFAKTGAFQQFAVRIRRFLRRLRGKLKSDADLIHIERLLQRAVKAAKESPAATQSGEVRSYINPNFAKDYAGWNKQSTGGYFFLGTTSQALHSVGINPSRIYWDKAKIKKILLDPNHDMKNSIVKVPDILENPILIMQSQTVLNRVVLINEVVDDNGVPVVCALELMPNGQIQNFVKIASAYGKDSGLQALIDSSDILYVDPNKKRTDTWLKAFRLQLPAGLTKYGSIGRVTLFKRDVKGNVEIPSKKESKTAFEIAFEKAKASTDNQSMQNGSNNSQGGQNSIPFGFSMGATATAPTRRSRFNRASVDEQAKKLMRDAGAKGERAEVVRVLEDFYEYVAQGQELSWDSITDAAQPVVDWLTEHHQSRNAVDEYSREVLREIRRVYMKLGDVQKSEAAAIYGSYGEFHKKAIGTVIFSDNATISLEERWRELAEVYPEYFDPNENATDMPIRLLEIVDRLRQTNTAAEEYRRNMAEVRGDLTSAVYDSYWNVSEVRTERDRYEDRVYDLKEQHRAEMREERALRERAVAEERMRGDVRVTQERQRAREREQRIKEQNRVQRERASDRQKRTEMREKIRKVVKELNTMLLKGSKERPVMNGLREAVAAALNAVQMVDAEGYEQGLQKRLDYYDQRIYSESDPEVAAVLQKERDKVAARVDSMKKRLSDLSAAYSSIIASNDSAMQIYKHDAEMVKAKIETVVELVGDTPLRYMNMRQLEAVHDLYTMVLTTVRNANKLFKQGKAEDLQSNAERIMDEISEFSSFEVDGYSETSEPARILRNFSWNQLKPIYAFKRLGSETFMSLYRELRRGEDTVARDLKEADDFAGEIRKKYGWDSWDLKKTYKFKLEDGRTLPLTLPQMMSIYAYSKRPQAQKHIELGGFVFSDKESFKADRGVFDVTRSSRESWRVDAYLLTRIAAKMREVDENCLAYVDEMQQYLSTVMGAKGNEVSRVMWGVDLFKEKHYFPLKSSHDFMFEQNTVNPAVSLKSSGMTKRTTPHASNPIVLEGFDKVWADHVTQMSNYHGYVIPIDNINKVHNYATYINVNQSQSVATVIASVFGASANDYFEKLIQDLNGGVKTKAAVTLFPRLIGNAKKTAVAASMSTVIQQPTAIVRAMAMIAPKYFVGKYNKNKHGEKWEELKRYAPIAILKEIGGIDTTSRRGTTEWLNRRHYKGVAAKTGAVLTDSYYRDDKLMAAASKADEVGWLMIWEAVKREQAKALHMDTSSSAFLEKCGERFTEVIECTQVYDSTLSRSGLMRSEGEFMKMATAFMGEPTTSYNMLMDAVLQARRTKGAKAKKHAARVIGSVYASIALSSLFASAIYALRDDDEDEAFIDKWAEQFGKKFSSDFWVHNMIPFVRDIASIADGWDVERMDMAIIADLYSAIDSLTSDNKTTWRKIEDLAGAVGALGGIPLRNLLRTGREMYNAVRFSIDDAAPKHPGERILQGAMGDLWDKIAKDQYERTTEAIQDGDGLPMRYKKDPTVRAIADLYEETKKEREKIEEDETLTDAERDEALGKYDLGAIIGNGDIGSKWCDNEGDCVIKDEEAVDEATRLLRQSYKAAADLLVPSEEFSAADTPGKIDLLEAMYDDIYEMTKNAFKSMPAAEAVDTVEDYLETVKETETYDPDIVNAYATVTLSDGKPLITNKDLCARYKKAVDDVYEKRMNEAKGVYTWKKDGVEHKIYTSRATTEEMAFIEKRELEFARSDIASLFKKVDAATLIAELDHYSADIVRKRLL